VSDSSIGHEDEAATDPEISAAAAMLPVNARKVVLLGTGLFLAVFIVLLPFWSWLGEHHHRVWLWTALSGAVLGLLALPLVRKHTGEGRLG
jgi:hypothetical protein